MFELIAKAIELALALFSRRTAEEKAARKAAIEESDRAAREELEQIRRSKDLN